MTVLIPSYEPGIQLLELIIKIKEKCSFNIVIIDDGSSRKYMEIFKQAEKLGCSVLTHINNLGKGHALKTGFDFIKNTGENIGVVCVDSNGQHSAEDIIKIARNIEGKKGSIVLGRRQYSGKVPLHSKFGNILTRTIFYLQTGTTIYDTQTGLRGYSIEMLDWLYSVPGENFEYEINVLLDAKKAGYSFLEVDIDTVYCKRNRSSYIHAIRDSIRVYQTILKFSASSLVSAIIDLTLLFIIKLFTSNLLTSVIISRACSSIFNFTVNRNFVFSYDKDANLKNSLFKYFTLVIIFMLFNYLLIFIFNELIGIPLFLSKLLTETTIFLFSYWSQHKFVFAH